LNANSAGSARTGLTLRAAATASSAAATMRVGSSRFADQTTPVASRGVAVAEAIARAAAARGNNNAIVEFVATDANVRCAAAGVPLETSGSRSTANAAAVEPAVVTGRTDKNIELIVGVYRYDRVNPAGETRVTIADVAVAFATVSDYRESPDPRGDDERLLVAGVRERLMVLKSVRNGDRVVRRNRYR